MGGGSVILKLVREMLIKVLTMPGRTSPPTVDIDSDEDCTSEQNNLPEDVKEGHFVIHTVDKDGNIRRFIIALSYLTHPDFLNLLEQAEEEFGFKQEGVLAVPCGHSDLERILGCM
ncbi:hypothetical protein ACH5RR_005491 [Cinchona calisaya]|uniref:Uncharacterized protein n=1 Tax=Cinchona calisaya TaxID=153742 RepID=A0ABD3ALC1_9GENT